MKAFLLVFIGGGLGSLMRYAFSIWFAVSPFKPFPWPTFLANVLSCLLLGIALKKMALIHPYENLGHWLLITGFCGGFSTFSTFSFEVLTLLRTGMPAMAIFYVLLSVLTGLFFVWIGYWL
jgi:CrcB protein